MIVAHMQVPAGGKSAPEIAELFEESAPRCMTWKGLIRKYYLLSEDGSTAGGVYLWNSKAEAEAIMNNEWKAYLKERYGGEPVITYFECPVIADKITSEILTAHEIKKVA